MKRFMYPAFVLQFMLAVLLAACPEAAHAEGRQNLDAIDDHVLIYLGTIAVDGQRRVFEALQDIKVALSQPISADPRFAEVVVCRLADELGSHAKQVLICGSNRALAQNRELMQTALAAGLSAGNDCGPGNCSGRLVGVLSDSVNSQPHLYMLQQVNGPSFQALLASIPYPSIGPGTSRPAPWLPREPSPSICGDLRTEARPAAKPAPRLTDCIGPAV